MLTICIGMQQVIFLDWLFSATNTLERLSSFITFLYSHRFDTLGNKEHHVVLYGISCRSLPLLISHKLLWFMVVAYCDFINTVLGSIWLCRRFVTG